MFDEIALVHLVAGTVPRDVSAINSRIKGPVTDHTIQYYLLYLLNIYSTECDTKELRLLTSGKYVTSH